MTPSCSLWGYKERGPWEQMSELSWEVISILLPVLAVLCSPNHCKPKRSRKRVTVSWENGLSRWVGYCQSSLIWVQCKCFMCKHRKAWFAKPYQAGSSWWEKTGLLNPSLSFCEKRIFPSRRFEPLRDFRLSLFGIKFSALFCLFLYSEPCFAVLGFH